MWSEGRGKRSPVDSAEGTRRGRDVPRGTADGNLDHLPARPAPDLGAAPPGRRARRIVGNTPRRCRRCPSTPSRRRTPARRSSGGGEPARCNASTYRHSPHGSSARPPRGRVGRPPGGRPRRCPGTAPGATRLRSQCSGAGTSGDSGRWGSTHPARHRAAWSAYGQRCAGDRRSRRPGTAPSGPTGPGRDGFGSRRRRRGGSCTARPSGHPLSGGDQWCQSENLLEPRDPGS